MPTTSRTSGRGSQRSNGGNGHEHGHDGPQRAPHEQEAHEQEAREQEAREQEAREQELEHEAEELEPAGEPVQASAAAAEEAAAAEDEETVISAAAAEETPPPAMAGAAGSRGRGNGHRHEQHPMVAAERTARHHSVRLQVPFIGRVELPATDELAFMGGVAVLAVVGAVDWPVAVAVAAGHALTARHRNRVVEEFGEALETV